VSSPDAAWAVLCAPTQHLNESDPHRVVEAMPPALQPLLQPYAQHQTAYGLEGFLRRVAAHLDLTPAEADTIARGVFAALHEWLPAKEIDNAASRLPRDLRDLRDL
jgi:uncharacterized protein (DUF2267 family)